MEIVLVSESERLRDGLFTFLRQSDRQRNRDDNGIDGLSEGVSSAALANRLFPRDSSIYWSFIVCVGGGQIQNGFCSV